MTFAAGLWARREPPQILRTRPGGRWVELDTGQLPDGTVEWVRVGKFDCRVSIRETERVVPCSQMDEEDKAAHSLTTLPKSQVSAYCLPPTSTFVVVTTMKADVE